MLYNKINDLFKSVSNPSQLELRNDVKHLRECNLLYGSLCEHYSKTYGINHRSALLDIPNFSIFNGGLAHDIMHDILEGVAPLEVSLVLRHYIIYEKFITLEDYYRLTHFDFNYTEMSKPPLVQS